MSNTGIIGRPEKFSFFEAQKLDAGIASMSKRRLGFASVNASDNYVTRGEAVILLNCDTASPDGIVLSTADLNVPGRAIVIKAISGSEISTISTEGSGLIDGQSSITIEGGIRRQSRTFISDGTSWWALSEIVSNPYENASSFPATISQVDVNADGESPPTLNAFSVQNPDGILGWSVKLNPSMTRLYVSAPQLNGELKIYDFDSNFLPGGTPRTLLPTNPIGGGIGYAVSFDLDATESTLVVITDRLPAVGDAAVYIYTSPDSGATWNLAQKLLTVNGNSVQGTNGMGVHVRVSGDGTRIALHMNIANASTTGGLGVVEVMDTSDNWATPGGITYTRLDVDPPGVTNVDLNRNTLSMSADGNAISIGVNSGGNDQEITYVWNYNGAVWSSTKLAIPATAGPGYTRTGYWNYWNQLSPDGNYLAVCNFNVTAGAAGQGGEVYIYKYSGGSWGPAYVENIQWPITPTVGGGFGQSMHWDPTGNVLAIKSGQPGAPLSERDWVHLFTFDSTTDTATYQISLRAPDTDGPNVSAGGNNFNDDGFGTYESIRGIGPWASICCIGAQNENDPTLFGTLTVATVTGPSDQFTVAGDATIYFPPGRQFYIDNTAGPNWDGFYNVLSSSFDGANTTVTTTTDIDDTATTPATVQLDQQPVQQGAVWVFRDGSL